MNDENKNNLDMDSVSRNRIVSETDKNFFVEAGAGSGKTTMLVNRMVAMVEAGEDISKICAITFTKAAAGEFYDRFQKILIERSNPAYVYEDKGYAGQLPPPTDQTREYCAKALQNIDLCFMGTIDSFCNMILSEHPSEAHIPSDATLMTAEDANILYKQEYIKICEGKYGDKLVELANMFRVLQRNPEELFVKGMSLFMDNRNVTFHYDEANLIDIDTTFAKEKAGLIKAVECLAEHPEFAYTGAQGDQENYDLLAKRVKNLQGKWSTKFARVMSTLKSFEKVRILPVALEKCGASLSGEIEVLTDDERGSKSGKWLNFSYIKKGGLLDRIEKLKYEVSMSFMQQSITAIEASMRERGAMTFFDYLFYLRNMLKEDAEKEGKLIKYIYNRHSYFLIDEFQDTNPMQAEVFFYLTAQNPVAEWHLCDPRPGSLFIVGDPKQSIYRFRGADVASFIRVKKLFENGVGDILLLSRNFRSRNCLLNYFNSTFSAMLPEESETQSKFEKIPVSDSEKTKEFEGIYTYEAYTGKLEAEHPGMSDNEQILNLITTLVDNDDYKITTAGDKALRRIKYNDIMIITAAKTNIGSIMTFLDGHNVPLRVEGKVPFEINEGLKAVCDIYKAVSDYNDCIAVYKALTGVLIDLKEDEIIWYRAAGGKIELRTVESCADSKDKVVKKVAAEIEKLTQLYYQARKLSPAALFSRIMDDYRIYNTVCSDNLEVIYYTLELIRNAEKSGLVISLKDGADYIENLLNGGSEEERCLSLTENKDCIHIANLHKVKGLEAPVVILAYAFPKNNTPSIHVEHIDSGSEGYVFDLSSERDENSRSFKYFSTDKYSDKQELESRLHNEENNRLVYVGATRARNALIICKSHCASGRGEAVKTRWKDLIAGVPDFFESHEITGSIKDRKYDKSPELLYDKASSESVLNNRSAEKATYKVENPSKLRLSSKLQESDENNTDDNEDKSVETSESKHHCAPALVGTMTHRLMELIVSTKDRISTDDAIDEIISEYGTKANQPYEAELREILKKVAGVIHSGGYSQKNDAPKDILKELLGAESVFCEVPFCYLSEEPDEKKVWNGVMDVVYCKDDIWHIIDYKTNAEDEGLDTKYSGQLAAYIAAFKATTGNDADAKIYHIDV